MRSPNFSNKVRLISNLAVNTLPSSKNAQPLLKCHCSEKIVDLVLIATAQHFRTRFNGALNSGYLVSFPRYSGF